MRKHLCLWALFTGLYCAPARAAPNDGYLGGSYDGFDQRSISASLAWLFVNNADGATNVTPTNAWLNGILVATSNSEPADVRVYWGMTDGVTNRENWATTNDFGSSIAEGQALTTNVSFTTPNTTYYYRFYATNAAGEAWAGSSSSFLAPGPPVLGTGLGALPVGSLTATLNGNLALGGSASIYVYWGVNDGGTTNTNWSHTNSLGTHGLEAFFTPVSGLSSESVYYYRCYGTNVNGDGWSAAASFTTRVAVAGFGGGSYDGYDQCYSQATMVGVVGTLFYVY